MVVVEVAAEVVVAADAVVDVVADAEDVVVKLKTTL